MTFVYYSYLVDQFFSLTSNFRNDQYGGSLENRLRFGLEVVDAVASAVGPKRTAIRISPYSPFQEMKMDTKDIKETFGAFVTALQEKHPDLAYLHVVRSRIAGSTDFVSQGQQEETLDFLVSSPDYNHQAEALRRAQTHCYCFFL